MMYKPIKEALQAEAVKQRAAGDLDRNRASVDLRSFELLKEELRSDGYLVADSDTSLSIITCNGVLTVTAEDM
jgi:hypothetical protein